MFIFLCVKEEEEALKKQTRMTSSHPLVCVQGRKGEVLRPLNSGRTYAELLCVCTALEQHTRTGQAIINSYKKLY